MVTDDFDPADAASWLARGRTPEHAAAIAAAWRDFPDLPSTAPLDERMQRGRERVAAMRVVNDAISAHGEAERQAANFAFTERQLRAGKGSNRDVAVLRGRDAYGYDWDVCNRYADGWYAAHAGWPHRYPEGVPCRAPVQVRNAAYDRGFSDGGGDRTDLFDAARRTNLAHLRESNLPPSESTAVTVGRPLPSSWPKPSDDPRPARWSRRLAILDSADTAEAGAEPAWDFLQILLDRPEADQATILLLDPSGLRRFNAPATILDDPDLTPDVAQTQLHALLHGREFDDILIAVPEHRMPLIDAIATALPLCRTMERTRNTRLQQRAHLRTWLDRGYGTDANIAAGHIRWSKAIHGLSGKLGEFTVRHVGPGPEKGHLIRVETRNGCLATGYADANGVALAPEVVVNSKARLRAAIASTLRTFAAATPLMGVLHLEAA